MRRSVPKGEAPEHDAPSIVVFSHANSFPASTYALMFDSLRQRGFAVSAVERYGHDPAYPVTNNWPHLVEQLRDHVEQVLAQARACGHAHDGKAWLVGHSLGGFLSLMTAALHPHLTHGVVMLDSPVISGWKANALGVAKRTPLAGAFSPGATSRKRRNAWPNRDAVLAHFQHKRAFAKWDPRVLQAYVDHGTLDDPATGQRVLAFSREVETAIYNTLPHTFDTLLRKHPLKLPVSFIGGTHSEEVRRVGMDATQRCTKGRVAMLEGTHLFPMEKPLATAAAIEAALIDMGATNTR